MKEEEEEERRKRRRKKNSPIFILHVAMDVVFHTNIKVCNVQFILSSLFYVMNFVVVVLKLEGVINQTWR